MKIDGMVFFILGMWMFLTARRRSLFQKRLMAAKQNTAKKRKESLGTLTTTRRRRQYLVCSAAQKGKLANFDLFLAYNELNCQYNKCVFCILQVFHISQLSRRNRPSVWTFNRASEWWDVIVPGFTNTQWLENFRMSEETFIHLCNKLHPAMERRDTNFRVCVPL